MQNKNVGWLIVGISIFIGAIIWIFNTGIKSTLDATCKEGPTCSMYTTLSLQTWISIAIAMVIFFIGLFFALAKENQKIIIKKISSEKSLSFKKFDKKTLKQLDAEEKKIMNLLLQNNNSIFQSELVEKSGFNKVRITRILDGLEARGLIERRRRGMTNIIILKQ